MYIEKKGHTYKIRISVVFGNVGNVLKRKWLHKEK